MYANSEQSPARTHVLGAVAGRTPSAIGAALPTTRRPLETRSLRREPAMSSNGPHRDRIKTLIQPTPIKGLME